MKKQMHPHSISGSTMGTKVRGEDFICITKIQKLT